MPSPKDAIRDLQNATSGRSGVVLAEGWRTVAGEYAGGPALLIQRFTPQRVWTTVAALTTDGQLHATP